MIDYVSSLNTNGLGFPQTAAKMATGAGATDGTQFIDLFIDDLWGARQALMAYAGLTPDTVPEAWNASQHLDALKKSFGWPGEVVAWCGSTNFTGFGSDSELANGIKLMLLAGQGILRATYADLDAAVYCGNSANPTASAFYHADDAAGTSRNTAGVYLILPDFRGVALRGLDTAAAIDPDGAGRDLGNIQKDGMQRHGHDIYPQGTGYTIWDPGAANVASGSGKRCPEILSSGTLIDAAGITDEYGVSYAGWFTPGSKDNVAETRMYNGAVNWVIRY